MNRMINNYSKLTGKLEVFKFSDNNGSTFLKGRIKIPEEFVDNNDSRNIYYTNVNIMCFGSMAKDMFRCEGKWITVQGNIETNKYESKCAKCNFPNTNYWVYVRVSNFVVVEAPFDSNIDYVN